MKPKFGQWFRGIHASENNPHRDGRFVEVIHRSGRVMNPGTFYRLTDGKGGFWEYPKDSVIPIRPPNALRDALEQQARDAGRRSEG